MRSEAIFHKSRQQMSKRDKEYSDLKIESAACMKVRKYVLLVRSTRILSPGPSAREAQNERLLASRPPPGRTLFSIGRANEAGDGS